MTGIRHFTERDAAVILQRQYPEAPISDIHEMIPEWETNTCHGNYLEMFAITVDDAVVGNVSLYEHTKTHLQLAWKYILTKEETDMLPGMQWRSCILKSGYSEYV